MVGKEYKVVGRMMEGASVKFYVAQTENGEKFKFTRDQLCFLIGKKQVLNCKAQLYEDTVVITGVGVNITDLPSIQVENVNIIKLKSSEIDRSLIVKRKRLSALGKIEEMGSGGDIKPIATKDMYLLVSNDKEKFDTNNITSGIKVIKNNMLIIMKSDKSSKLRIEFLNESGKDLKSINRDYLVDIIANALYKKNILKFVNSIKIIDADNEELSQYTFD